MSTEARAPARRAALVARRIGIGIAIAFGVSFVGFIVVAAIAANLPAPSPNQPAVQAVGPRGDSGTTVTEVVLRNGVPCAVMDGAESKSIACNWQVRGPQTGIDPRGDRGTTITLVILPGGTECAVMDGKPGKALSCEGRT